MLLLKCFLCNLFSTEIQFQKHCIQASGYPINRLLELLDKSIYYGIYKNLCIFNDLDYIHNFWNHKI